GLETGRATLDVDLAAAVDSWPEFERIKTRLVETGEVTTDEMRPHRLFYRTSEGGKYPLDLLPFGGLEQRPSEIAWPPDLSVVMNVAGYREAPAAGPHRRESGRRPARRVRFTAPSPGRSWASHACGAVGAAVHRVTLARA